MKKKQFNFKNPIVVATATTIVSVGIIFAFLGKIVDFIRAPQVLAGEIKNTNDRVEKWAEITQQLADQSKEQKIYNKVVTDILNKDGIIYSEDKKKYWNERLKEWRPVKELDSR